MLWLDGVAAEGLWVSELGDDGLELCAQAIAVANIAIAALIKTLFIPNPPISFLRIRCLAL